VAAGPYAVGRCEFRTAERPSPLRSTLLAPSAVRGRTVARDGWPITPKREMCSGRTPSPVSAHSGETFFGTAKILVEPP